MQKSKATCLRTITEKIAHVFVAECQTKSKCSYVGEQIEKILKEKLKHD